MSAVVISLVSVLFYVSLVLQSRTVGCQLLDFDDSFKSQPSESYPRRDLDAEIGILPLAAHNEILDSLLNDETFDVKNLNYRVDRSADNNQNQMYQLLLKLALLRDATMKANDTDPNTTHWNGVSVNDINSHLPGRNPFGDTISGPINDPAEFEAARSQLTDTINHEIANTQNRSAMLEVVMTELYDHLMRDTSPEETVSDRIHKLGQYLRNGIDDDDEPNLKSSRYVDKLEIIGDLAKQQQEANFGANSFDSNGADLSEPTTDNLLSASLSRYGGSEYIDHPLAIVGHQYVQGGAGEGRQLLGPEGTFENVQVVKSDHAVPSYCDPPNPCPIGYTAADGCLENFINTASFSREYQATQKCSCDNEHSLFNCEANQQEPDEFKKEADGSSRAPAQDSADGSAVVDDDDNEADNVIPVSGKLNTLARAIGNRFGDWPSVSSWFQAYDRTESGVGEELDNNLYGNLASGGLLERSTRKLGGVELRDDASN